VGGAAAAGTAASGAGRSDGVGRRDERMFFFLLRREGPIYWRKRKPKYIFGRTDSDEKPGKPRRGS